MKSEISILLLCPGLEDARNGVGDFSATVAATLAAQGQRAAAVSVADTFSDLPSPPPDHRREEIRTTHAGPVRLLRLGSAHPDPWGAAGRFARELNITWVSLQFVCWGYHPRGICRGLPGRFARFAEAAAHPFHTHIFLHELHCGRRPSDPFREKLLGWLQLKANRCALRRLGAACVHTSTTDYAAEAKKNYGLNAAILAIPSALPPPPPAPASRVEYRAKLRDMFGISAAPAELLVGCAFGSVYHSWNPAPALDSLLATASAASLTPAVLHVGRASAGVAHLGKLCGERGIAFAPAGPRPAAEAAALLAACDLGLAAMPPDALGKSSAAAALLDLGLPLIVTEPPRDGFGRDHSFPFNHRIHFVNETNPAPCPHPFPGSTGEAWLGRFAASLAASFAKPPPFS